MTIAGDETNTFTEKYLYLLSLLIHLEGTHFEMLENNRPSEVYSSVGVGASIAMRIGRTVSGDL